MSIDSNNPEIFESEKVCDTKLANQSVNRHSKSSIKIGKKIKQQITTP